MTVCAAAGVTVPKAHASAWFYENVVPFQNNDVYELLGKGDGTFAPAKLVIQNLTNPAVADLNHDGRPDVVENRDPQWNYSSANAPPQFSVFLCQPDGSFTLTETYAPVGGDKGFDTQGFVAECRNMQVTPLPAVCPATSPA